LVLQDLILILLSKTRKGQFQQREVKRPKIKQEIRNIVAKIKIIVVTISIGSLANTRTARFLLTFGFIYPARAKFIIFDYSLVDRVVVKNSD